MKDGASEIEELNVGSAQLLASEARRRSDLVVEPPMLAAPAKGIRACLIPPAHIIQQHTFPGCLPHGARMEIAFRTRTLRDLCENEGKLRDQLGVPAAASLMARLADMAATSTPLELPPELLVTPPNPSSPSLRIRVSTDLVAVFTSNHARAPQTADGGIDWSRVTRVRLERTEALHD
jgi:hypothetical protein